MLTLPELSSLPSFEEDKAVAPKIANKMFISSWSVLLGLCPWTIVGQYNRVIPIPKS